MYINTKYLKKQAASVALSFALAGSSGVAMAVPAFALEDTNNDKEIEQPIDEQEEVKEETKEEVKEVAKEETKEEVQEVAKEEVKEETKEEAVKEEVKEEAQEEKTEAVKEEKEETKEEKEEEEKVEEEKEQKTEEVANEEKQVTRAVSSNKSTSTSTSEEHKVPCITTKVDENGNPLKGAVLQILDKDGNVLDEWISDGTEHETMLPEGEYILHEKSAPDGYKIAADQEFVVKVEVKDMEAGVDFSETPCDHYGGTPLYYVESDGEKSEVYCINQDWETPDENSVYDGKVITPTDITSYTHQTIYVDAHQNKESKDISDKTLTSQELYDKVLDIVYHRQKATDLFSDLTEAEIRYVTESALKNYTNAGLTRVQRVTVANAPDNYESTDYYITADGKYMWYLYPWYRSFVYNPDAPLGKDIFTTSIGNGDAFGTLARHWSSGHNAKNSEEVRQKIARYYELYQYLVSDRDRHPDDMHLYIFHTDNKSVDTSGNDFDEGAYQNLLGIRWYDPYDENYKVYLLDVNTSITKPDEPEIPDEPEKPITPEKPEKPIEPKEVKTSTKPENHNTIIVNSPQTGDPFELELALATLGASAMGLAGVARIRRRK